MNLNKKTAISVEMSHFLTAFDLDRANISDIDIYHEHEGVFIDVKLNIKEHKCPLCGSVTSKVKSYQTKRINHSVLNPVACTIIYHARRYVCPVCGKTFYENNPFCMKSSRASVATVYNVLTELKRPEVTFTYLGQKYHMSPSSIANIFDKHISISRRKLPECMCLDEVYAFKSKERSDDSKYVCVLLDYKNNKIVDLLPTRRKYDLIKYFSKIPVAERKQVKYISIDMWETYRQVQKTMFPNSALIVDKFHVLQELMRDVERVRITVMNEYKSKLDALKIKKKAMEDSGQKLEPEDAEHYMEYDKAYYLLKKFNWVLYSKNEDILDPNVNKKFNHKLNQYLNLYDIYTYLTELDDDLTDAINVRDNMHKFYRDSDYSKAKEELEKIIIQSRTCNTKSMQSFSNTLTRWKQEIINSFIKIDGSKRISNGLIENRNKTIKLIKRSSNGYTNWKRFRNRVLYVLNDDAAMKIE